MHPALAPSAQGDVFYWNIDGPVGLQGMNKRDDVMFVQWCFYKMGKWDRMTPDLRAICSKTLVNGECSGREDDPLVGIIKALQRSQKGLKVDGRVTPPTTDIQYNFHGSSHLYLIFYLNAALRGLHPAQYPRLDLMPEFIWRIRDKVTKPFV
jgi:hypothetical protein